MQRAVLRGQKKVTRLNCFFLLVANDTAILRLFVNDCTVSDFGQIVDQILAKVFDKGFCGGEIPQKYTVQLLRALKEKSIDNIHSSGI